MELALAISALLMASAESAPPCPPVEGMTQADPPSGKWYRFFSDPKKSFEDARSHCSGLGLSLATINNASEYAKVVQFIGEKWAEKFSSRFWADLVGYGSYREGDANSMYLTSTFRISPLNQTPLDFTPSIPIPGSTSGTQI